MTFGAIYVAFYCGDSSSIVALSLSLGFHCTWVKIRFGRCYSRI